MKTRVFSRIAGSGKQSLNSANSGVTRYRLSFAMKQVPPVLQFFLSLRLYLSVSLVKGIYYYSYMRVCILGWNGRCCFCDTKTLRAGRKENCYSIIGYFIYANAWFLRIRCVFYCHIDLFSTSYPHREKKATLRSIFSPSFYARFFLSFPPLSCSFYSASQQIFTTSFEAVP